MDITASPRCNECSAEQLKLAATFSFQGGKGVISLHTHDCVKFQQWAGNFGVGPVVLGRTQGQIFAPGWGLVSIHRCMHLVSDLVSRDVNSRD